VAQNRNAYQEIVHGPLFESVTKYHVDVDTQNNSLISSARPFVRRPLEIPVRSTSISVAGMQAKGIESAEGDYEVSMEERFTRCPSMRPEPETEAVLEAVRLLEEAERPVIVARGRCAKFLGSFGDP